MQRKVLPRKVLGVVGLHNVPGLFSSGSQVLDGAIQLLFGLVQQGMARSQINPEFQSQRVTRCLQNLRIFKILIAYCQ